MRIDVITIGRKPPAWVQAAWRDYHQRLPATYRLSLVELPIGGSPDSARRLAQESERIDRAIPAGATRVLLDERGEGWDSRALAGRLDVWGRQGRPLCLLIGGPDGVDAAQQRQAEQRWSLSPLTLPHALVRVILIEQLYRAATILAGHPYHRD